VSVKAKVTRFFRYWSNRVKVTSGWSVEGRFEVARSKVVSTSGVWVSLAQC